MCLISAIEGSVSRSPGPCSTWAMRSGRLAFGATAWATLRRAGRCPGRTGRGGEAGHLVGGGHTRILFSLVGISAVGLGSLSSQGPRPRLRRGGPPRGCEESCCPRHHAVIFSVSRMHDLSISRMDGSRRLAHSRACARMFRAFERQHMFRRWRTSGLMGRRSGSAFESSQVPKRK